MVLALAGVFVGNKGSVGKWLSDWRAAKIIERDEGREKVELERRRKIAIEEAGKVLDAFGSAATASAADAEASKWILKWRNDAAATGIFAGKTNEFSRARTERLARDAAAAAAERLRAAKAEADRIVAACRGTNETSSACAGRIASWREIWRGEIAESDFSGIDKDLSFELAGRKNRDARDEAARKRAELLRQRRIEAAANAVAAAAKVESGYADSKTSIVHADAAYAAWRGEWREVLDIPSVASAESSISEARKRRAEVEDGIKVVSECERNLENILLIGAEDVKNWRNLVRQAEIALQQAENDHRIGTEQAEALRRRIENCRRWTVGVIDNKTDRIVEFGGQAIGPVTAATIVFTNGYPVGTSLTSEGCEPIHVREERFASRVFTVMPRDLEERVCETKAVVPDVPKGVLCLVDGIKRKAGEISLRRGRHVVRYCRLDETNPGVKDYEPKEYTFETRLSGPVEVPGPTGAWSHSADFKALRRNAELAKQAKELESKCRSLLDPIPVETRRDRLERVYALLADWKTPTILAALGVGTEKALRAEYDAERLRIRGHVRNETPFTIAVSTDTGVANVPPGETRLVTFERRWPADAHITVAGYEFIMLPQESLKFDGNTFVVSPERLVPLPVRMTVPPLETGVVCRVDGNKVEGDVELRPGEHEAVYSKPDFVSQKIPFTVRVATPAALPAPAKMEPSGAFSSLASALKAFNSGAVDAAKQLTDSIGTVEDPKRRRELQDLKRAIDLRKQLEKENR